MIIKLITIAIIGLIIYAIFEIGFFFGNACMFSVLKEYNLTNVKSMEYTFDGGHISIKKIITESNKEES